MYLPTKIACYKSIALRQCAGFNSFQTNCCVPTFAYLIIRGKSIHVLVWRNKNERGS